ncbi:MAG: hypothetical protein CM15mP18_5070 [Methanobacteriota archaeon]|nr:MAG: hypothetical protein CM15mP18_5070 [Euryarchaeota archaeon]
MLYACAVGPSGRRCREGQACQAFPFGIAGHAEPVPLPLRVRSFIFHTANHDHVCATAGDRRPTARNAAGGCPGFSGRAGMPALPACSGVGRRVSELATRTRANRGKPRRPGGSKVTVDRVETGAYRTAHMSFIAGGCVGGVCPAPTMATRPCVSIPPAFDPRWPRPMMHATRGAGNHAAPVSRPHFSEKNRPVCNEEGENLSCRTRETNPFGPGFSPVLRHAPEKFNGHGHQRLGRDP